MSIPAYQLQSLAGDNYAKKRVIKKQHKQYETEEPRTQVSGKINDDIKSVFDGILRNLQMQLTAISVAEATVDIGINNPDAEMEEEFEDLRPRDDTYTIQGVIGGLARLVGLAFELKFLFAKLAEIKKGVLPSIDFPRIQTAFDKVDSAYGNYGESGFLLALSEVVEDREGKGLPVPQTDKLMDMYELRMEECRDALLALEGNVYNQNLTSISLPNKPDEVMPVAEYKFLMDLKREGFLDDDFEILSGMRSELFRRIGREDDDSTIGTYESSSGSDVDSGSGSDSDDDDSSGQSYYAPSSVFSSAQNSRQSGHHSHASRGSQGMGLAGGVRYTIPQHQKLHGGFPLRYY